MMQENLTFAQPQRLQVGNSLMQREGKNCVGSKITPTSCGGSRTTPHITDTWHVDGSIMHCSHTTSRTAGMRTTAQGGKAAIHIR
eukprot:scaffold315723_cov13-Tisochrysis_lutea.AAC.1